MGDKKELRSIIEWITYCYASDGENTFKLHSSFAASKWTVDEMVENLHEFLATMKKDSVCLVSTGGLTLLRLKNGQLLASFGEVADTY